MRVLRPYLIFLIRGLSRLPAIEIFVFRGVPASYLDVMRECQRYKPGVEVYKSAFTRTSNYIF